MNRRDFLKLGVATAGGVVLTRARAQTAPGPIGAPRVGSVHAGSDRRTVGRFEKLELTFDVVTGATNLQIPYDPRPAAWTGNLNTKEDATQGVSVDALLLPPGQKDWSEALTHPCFLYRPYRSTPLPAGFFNNTETLVATGPDVWMLRFAPTRIGAWQVRIRVTDAGGQSVTPAAEAFLFFCASSERRGFLRVSPTDGRYFAFDNGSPCDLIGQNIFPKDWAEMKGAVDSISATGARAFLRLWIGSRSGQEIVGGWSNSTAGRYLSYFGTGSGLTGADTHSGRYAFDLPGDGGLDSAELSLKPDTAYTFSFWAKLKDPNGTPAAVRVVTQDSYTYANTQNYSILVEGPVWERHAFALPAHDPQNGTDYRGAFKIEGKGDGHVLIDDVQVTEDATGLDVYEVGDFERHVQYNLKQSWLLDEFLDYADARGHCVRLTCLENDEDMFCDVGSDALPSPHSPANFYSNSTDPDADTPVRRWHQYYARYLAARWGYSTAVAQYEFCNESDFGSGAGSWAAARNFARAIHSYQAHGRRLCSTSFYQNSGGSSYNAVFWDDPANTDMDYADVHTYPAEGVAYLPGGSGFVRLETGGPGGLGRLHIDDATRAGQSQVLEVPMDRLRGAGTWKIEYDVRADASARMNWFNRGPDMGFFSNNDGTINNVNIPGSDGGPTAPALPPGLDWQHRVGTFRVADGDYRQARLVVNCATLSGGSVDYAGIRVTAPTGRTWAYYPFNEPRTDQDTAAFAQYLGLAYTSYSGDPSIGKPLTIGETDLVTPTGYDTGIQSDTDGVYMRQFCWAHLNPSGCSVFLYTNAGGWAMGHGFYKYAAAYQRFLQGVPFDSGGYRHIEAGVSDPRLIVIGQKDVRSGSAHFYAYNRDANWRNMTFAPAGVTPIEAATVTVPGLKAGTYRVETWDTSEGKVVHSRLVLARGGLLEIPLGTLTTDVAVKVARWSHSRRLS